MALDLNETGFTVFAGCLFPDEEAAQSLLSKCRDPKKMRIVPVDVTSESSISGACEVVEKSLRENCLTLWSLVNNAGIASLSEFEWGSFDREITSVIQVNVIGLALVTRMFLPLIRRSRGRVININSVASRHSPPGMIAYDMSKHATLAFTECLRREMFKFGVKVISVEPFFYRTNIVDRDVCFSSATKAWKETNESIRSAYGEEYFKRFLRLSSSDSFGRFHRDPMEVVREVNHAVTAIYPKMSYAVTTYFWRFVLWYMACFNHPQEAEEMGWNFGAVVLGINKPIPSN